MDGPLVVLIFFGIILISIATWSWSRSKSHRLIGEWAKSEGYRLVSAEFCLFRRGPFFWTTSRNQTVYRIRVTDDEGHTLTGWARCGGYFAGLWSEKIDVRLDRGPPTRGIERVFE